MREVELGLVIGKGGRDISQENADSHIAGYGEPAVPREFPRSSANPNGQLSLLT